MSIPDGVSELQLKIARRKAQENYIWAAIKVLGLVVGILLTLGIYIGLDRIAQVTLSTNANTQLLKDCTTPGGNCYKNANKAQSGAVQNINVVTEVAVYCASQPGGTVTREVLRTCIKKELAR